MVPHAEAFTNTAPSTARTLFQLNSICTNMVSTNAPPNAHVRCEPIFNTTFGDIPRWIDPAITLCIDTQNVQGITPIKDDEKVQGGIGNMVSLQSGIMCLTETNAEWRNYIYRQAYKYASTKL
jgi:hypothetical protein